MLETPVNILPETVLVDPVTDEEMGADQSDASSNPETILVQPSTSTVELLPIETSVVEPPATPNSTIRMVKSRRVGSQNDDIISGTNRKDHLVGQDGDDILDGGAGKALLKGKAGDDTLIGGPGSDKLAGGFDNDIFVLESGNGIDTIRDWGNGDDQFGLGGALKFGGLTFTQQGAHTLIRTKDGEDLALVRKTAPEALTRDVFMRNFDSI